MQILGDRSTGPISAGIYGDLMAAKAQNRPNWFHANDSQGFIRVRRLIDDHLAWSDFSIRASRAAQTVGFPKDDAWKLSAAMGEIYSNVVEHSDRIDSGYLAFAANETIFEFVVGDKGIGILNSLRKNSNFVQLMDSGKALELALSEGVSSSLEPGRGYGYQPIFVGLANISKRLRFRSDDYGRELQRAGDGTIPAITMQLARLKGMFCSVLCSA